MKRRISCTVISIFILWMCIFGLNITHAVCKQPYKFNYTHQYDRKHLNTKTSLSELIQKLESPDALVILEDTDAVVYTDTMYSIASYKEKAIEPLINFIHLTNLYSAKYAAVLTLHLIGLESTVISRFHEEFKNKQARKALLELLSYQELQPSILKLLIKDPWSTDIPYFMGYLKKEGVNNWIFIKVLQKYNILTRPVHQEIPIDLGRINCDSNLTSSQVNTETFETGLLEQIVLQTNLLSNADSRRFKIEHDLFNEHIIGDIIIDSDGDFGGLLAALTECGDNYFGINLEYYYENGVVTLCSMKTAKTRWLDWYKQNKTIFGYNRVK